MHITNTVFVPYLLDTKIPSNELVQYLEMILKLNKKYGKKLYVSEVITNLKELDIHLHDILLLLWHFQKNKTTTIKTLIRMIKTLARDYKDVFSVNGDSDVHKEKLTAYLENNFDKSLINQNNKSTSWIAIKGEWWYYKRDLDQDLRKLLPQN